MSATFTVLHVVPRLNRGGGGASVFHEWHATHQQVGHAFLSLERDVDVSMLRAAMRRRIRVHVAPPPEEEAALLEQAEVVVMHFWQCPSIYEFCKRLDGRRLRLIIYSRVRGTTPPQILHSSILDLSDGWISTAPAELPYDRPQLWMPALIDPEVVSSQIPSRPKTPFIVAHCNTLNTSKMHPDFASLHAGYAVEIFGVGGDESMLSALPNATVRGFVEQWWTKTMGQVLGYPLHPATSSSSDKAVQEALFSGLPVVLLAPTGLEALVGNTALVAANATAYRAALERLAEDLAWREECAVAGREHAQECLHPSKNALKLLHFYKEIQASPARLKTFNVPKSAYLAAVHPDEAQYPAAAWHLAHAEGGRHHWANWPSL
jgi:hypothetical protein